MGILTDLFGEEFAGQAKRAAIVIVAIFVFVAFATRHTAQKEREQAASQQAEEAASCQKERAMSNDDAMAQCQNAAALFGQDISDNTTRLSACVEHREHALAQCTAKGL